MSDLAIPIAVGDTFRVLQNLTGAKRRHTPQFMQTGDYIRILDEGGGEATREKVNWHPILKELVLFYRRNCANYNSAGWDVIPWSYLEPVTNLPMPKAGDRCFVVQQSNGKRHPTEERKLVHGDVIMATGSHESRDGRWYVSFNAHFGSTNMHANKVVVMTDDLSMIPPCTCTITHLLMFGCTCGHLRCVSSSLPTGDI